MKIAICSDATYPVNEYVIKAVERLGHQTVLFGSLRSGKEENWAEVAIEAARVIANGQCEQGIFFCWSGTGICLAANKVPGIRAALCIDAETAKLAKVWNHANVLALSNRFLSNATADEILKTWFETPCDPKGDFGIEVLKKLEAHS